MIILGKKKINKKKMRMQKIFTVLKNENNKSCKIFKIFIKYEKILFFELPVF